MMLNKLLIHEFNNKTIIHEKLEHSIKAISNTHDLYGSEGAGMLLLGPSGVGKTKIIETYIKRYMNAYQELETPNLSKKPILSIRVPATPTVKGLIEKLLSAADHPAPTSSTVSKLEKRLSTLIKNQEVSLIILDEFQHMLRSQAQKSTRATLNFIKVLMDEHKLAVVMSGLPEALEAIRGYEELYQRFSHEHVRLFPFSSKTTHELNHLGKYLESCENILRGIGVQVAPLSSNENINRMLLATEGKARNINRIIVKAIQASKKESVLTITDFANAYNESPTNPNLGKFNPFLSNKEDAVKDRLLELNL